MARDLVCQMEVAEEGSRFFSDYGEEMYHFCSQECKRKFDDHPDQYIRGQAERELGI